MTGDLLISRREGLIQAEVDGELVALHIDKGTCYGFNVTATRIWSLIEQPRLLSELKQILLGEYDVDSDTCEKQLRDMVGELERDGLVATEPAPARA